MRIIAVTGSRELPESHAALVAFCLRDAEMIVTGDADGADAYARNALKAGQRMQVYSVASYPHLNRPAALAQRSIEMVKNLEQYRASAALVGFPIRPCPAEIKRPLRSWQACGSGTWSTLAMAAGRGVRIVVYRFGDMFLPVWPSCTWVKSNEFAGAFELEVKQTSLF